MAMDIAKKGLYVIMVASCNPSSATVEVRGNIDNVNPYGYLPAEVFPDMPFYASLAVLYLVFGVLWMVALCSYGCVTLSVCVYVCLCLCVCVCVSVSFCLSVYMSVSVCVSMC